MELKELLTQAVERGASDLHIVVGQAPILRINTELVPHPGEVVTEEVAAGFVREAVGTRRYAQFLRRRDLDFSLEVPGTGRFRVNAHFQKGSVAIAFRAIPCEVPPLGSLNLPPVVASFTDLPRGLVLVTGETGAGKSTTLAAMIDAINHKYARHIITLEDPVEYELVPDKCVIEQREVGSDVPNFASGLRHVLRQDPDIILVGEIRDAETADIAVQAALTGHLVLTSIHASDSASAIIRLIDLGVEPFLVTSAVICSLSQRLVRKVCPYCKTLTKVGPDEAMAYKKEMGEERDEFYVGRGCNFCSQTGFAGRIGVFEVMVVNEKIRSLILKGASSSEIKDAAVKDGMITMRRDGMMKARDGITTPKEVLRNVFIVG